MSATAETLALLKSIDASLKHLVAFHELPKSSASDKDLDSPHGDPEIRAKDPRDWTGPPMTGRKMSECPATYLDLLADRYDYFATKDTDEKKREYARRDAARSRGWAARIRSGYKAAIPPAEPEAEGFPSDMMREDDIEF